MPWRAQTSSARTLDAELPVTSEPVTCTDTPNSSPTPWEFTAAGCCLLKSCRPAMCVKADSQVLPLPPSELPTSLMVLLSAPQLARDGSLRHTV
jgi:hypothetical protein